MNPPIGLGTREAIGVGVRIGPGLGAILAFEECLGDRRATSGLHRHESRPAAARNPAEAFHFIERLPHADQAGAAAGGIDHHVGSLALELLDQLERHGLLAFDAIAAPCRGRNIEGVFRRPCSRRNFASVGDRALERDGWSRRRARIRIEEGFGRVVRHGDRDRRAGSRAVSGEGAGRIAR